MDRELVHSLLYLSPGLEKSLPEQRTEMERELSLFDRLIPILTQSLSPLRAPTPAATIAPQPRIPEPAVSVETVSRPPTIIGSHGHGAQHQRIGSGYAGGNIPFKRTFLNRSRIIKGP